MSTPLILDTDPALGVVYEGRPHDVDDAFAIAEALLAPELDVAGITVVHGNSRLADGTAVAREVITKAGADTPVYPGAAAALGDDSVAAENTEAIDFLHQTLAQGPARIAAIGPLTNLGALLRRHPEDAAGIEEVVIVAGRTAGNAFYLGNAGPVRDFNFECDPLAARILLEAEIPVTMIGFELSSQVTVTPATLDSIRTIDTPLTRHLADGSQAWMDFWRRTFPDDPGFHPWDSAAIAWLRDPGLFRHQQRGWLIREMALDEGAPTPWLETQGSFESAPVTFVSGFVTGGGTLFLERLVSALD